MAGTDPNPSVGLPAGQTTRLPDSLARRCCQTARAGGTLHLQSMFDKRVLTLAGSSVPSALLDQTLGTSIYPACCVTP